MNTFNLEFAIQNIPEILKAVPMTLFIAAISIIIGTIIGLFVALCRVYNIPFLNFLSKLFISFFRGVPLLIQLYVAYYGGIELVDYIKENYNFLPSNAEINPLLTALIAFSLYAGAYQAETIRSALTAVDKGQMEAAYSVGLTTIQALRRIILPQAFVSAIPNIGNLLIILIKATSVAFTVKVIEIMAVAKILASTGYNYIEMYLVAALVYWIICFLLERLFALLETKSSKFQKQATI